MRSTVVLGIFLAIFLGGQDARAQKAKPTSQAEAGIVIDRIDILGVKVFSDQIIERVVEISPGDQLERLKVVRTEEGLQALYLARGYEEVSIRSRLVRKRNDKKTLETVLEFEVKEGRPVRIAEIQLLPSGVLDEESQRLWRAREKRLKASLGLSVGDLLDQEKLAEGKRGIQELLASEEYIGAKVEKARSVPRSAPSGTDLPEANKNAARWVTVEFHVDVGDKVSFGFRGNTVFTRGHLDSLVDEQRLVGLGKDYVGAIRAVLEEEYHAAGYARVEVVPYTTESSLRGGRKVTYLIREGPRVKIDAIDFDGNSVFSSQVLREKFLSKASPLVQHDFYVEKDVQKAADLLIEWMKEKGYLAAKFITINSFYLPKPRTQQSNSSVRLLIYIYEGDQTLIQSLSVTGLNALGRDELKKLLRVEEGAPLNLFAFGEGVEIVKKTYRDKGYLGVKIVNEGTEDLIEYSQENHFADISLQVEEGPQYHVSSVEIEGLEKTKDYVVLRELTLHPGDILAESELVQSEMQLKRLGIFSTVTVRHAEDNAQPGYKIVRVSATEADRGILAWGPGFRNDLGIRAFGQLSYTNLWGMNHTLSMNASVNRRFYNYNFAEGQLQFSYLWPWFGLPGLTFRPAIAVAKTQYITFAADTLTASALWEKTLLSRPSLTGTFGYTVEKVNQFNEATVRDKGQLLIGSITPKLSLDFRDSPLSPTTGFFATSWFDLAYPFFGSESDIGFYRAQFRADYHLPLWKKISWYFSFRTGFEQNVAPSGNAIPLIKQFALGGIGSLRGYQEQQLNAQTLSITGSLSYVNYRAQLDLPFAGELKFGLFADAANLKQDSFSFGDLLYGLGFGFHYQTPVGPVNLDWGFKTAPKAGEDPYVIHFSVGII